jgi:hypothetical protein
MSLHDLSHYADLVSRMRVDFGHSTRIASVLEDALVRAGSGRAVPSCDLILGEPRVGKSCALQDFEERYPTVRSTEGIKKTVIYAEIPPNGSLKALLIAMLEALGDPKCNRGTVDGMTYRVKNLLVKAECKLVILDELQHLCDKGQYKMLYKTAEWLKSLVASRTFSLVVGGLPTAMAVVRSNPQLVDRFRAPIRVEPFDWANRASREEFRAVLDTIRCLLAPFELPDLQSDELIFATWSACAGKIGLLVKLLDQAVLDAIQRGAVQISLAHLQTAFEQVIFYADEFPIERGPFLRIIGGEDEGLMWCSAINALAASRSADDALQTTNLGSLRPKGKVTRGHRPAAVPQLTKAQLKQQLSEVFT